MIPKVYNHDAFKHWIELPVRFNDLDSLNHVNNAVFNSYFEEARLNFVQQIPEWMNDISEGKSFVLRQAKIDYITPITYPEVLLIGSGIIRVERVRVSALQGIYSKSTHKLHAIAETTGVWFDLQTQRPAPLPEVKGLETFLLSLDH